MWSTVANESPETAKTETLGVDVINTNYIHHGKLKNKTVDDDGYGPYSTGLYLQKLSPKEMVG